jgi:hypothetical protein
MASVVQWPISYIPVRQKPVPIFMRISRWLTAKFSGEKNTATARAEPPAEDAKGHAVKVGIFAAVAALKCRFVCVFMWVGGWVDWVMSFVVLFFFFSRWNGRRVENQEKKNKEKARDGKP